MSRISDDRLLLESMWDAWESAEKSGAFIPSVSMASVSPPCVSPPPLLHSISPSTERINDDQLNLSTTKQSFTTCLSSSDPPLSIIYVPPSSSSSHSSCSVPPPLPPLSEKTFLRPVPSINLFRELISSHTSVLSTSPTILSSSPPPPPPYRGILFNSLFSSSSSSQPAEKRRGEEEFANQRLKEDSSSSCSLRRSLSSSSTSSSSSSSPYDGILYSAVLSLRSESTENLSSSSNDERTRRKSKEKKKERKRKKQLVLSSSSSSLSSDDELSSPGFSSLYSRKSLKQFKRKQKITTTHNTQKIYKQEEEMKNDHTKPIFSSSPPLPSSSSPALPPSVVSETVSSAAVAQFASAFSTSVLNELSALNTMHAVETAKERVEQDLLLASMHTEINALIKTAEINELIREQQINTIKQQRTLEQQANWQWFHANYQREEERERERQKEHTLLLQLREEIQLMQSEKKEMQIENQKQMNERSQINSSSFAELSEKFLSLFSKQQELFSQQNNQMEKITEITQTINKNQEKEQENTRKYIQHMGEQIKQHTHNTQQHTHIPSTLSVKSEGASVSSMDSSAEYSEDFEEDQEDKERHSQRNKEEKKETLIHEEIPSVSVSPPSSDLIIDEIEFSVSDVSPPLLLPSDEIIDESPAVAAVPLDSDYIEEEEFIVDEVAESPPAAAAADTIVDEVASESPSSSYSNSFVVDDSSSSPRPASPTLSSVSISSDLSNYSEIFGGGYEGGLAVLQLQENELQENIQKELNSLASSSYFADPANGKALHRARCRLRLEYSLEKATIQRAKAAVEHNYHTQKLFLFNQKRKLESMKNTKTGEKYTEEFKDFSGMLMGQQGDTVKQHIHYHTHIQQQTKKERTEEEKRVTEDRPLSSSSSPVPVSVPVSPPVLSVSSHPSVDYEEEFTIDEDISAVNESTATDQYYSSFNESFQPEEIIQKEKERNKEQATETTASPMNEVAMIEEEIVEETEEIQETDQKEEFVPTTLISTESPSLSSSPLSHDEKITKSAETVPTVTESELTSLIDSFVDEEIELILTLHHQEESELALLSPPSLSSSLPVSVLPLPPSSFSTFQSVETEKGRVLICSSLRSLYDYLFSSSSSSSSSFSSCVYVDYSSSPFFDPLITRGVFDLANSFIASYREKEETLSSVSTENSSLLSLHPESLINFNYRQPTSIPIQLKHFSSPVSPFLPPPLELFLSELSSQLMFSSPSSIIPHIYLDEGELIDRLVEEEFSSTLNNPHSLHSNDSSANWLANQKEQYSLITDMAEQIFQDLIKELATEMKAMQKQVKERKGKVKGNAQQKS